MSNDAHRVFLISTPSPSEFLGYGGEHTCILYAAAVLWDQLKRKKVFDCDGDVVSHEQLRFFAWRGLSSKVWSELEGAFREEKPKVVAISMCTATSRIALKIAELAKNVLPDCGVIFGGPHEDGMTECQGTTGAQYSPFVDVSVGGDGEFVLHQLVRGCLASRRTGRDYFQNPNDALKRSLRTMRGRFEVTFRKSSGGSEKIRAARPLVKEDDGPLPRLPRELLFNQRRDLARGFNPTGIDENDVRTAQIITERGCDWRCSFCAEWRTSRYVRSVEDVIAEIEEAINWGYRAIWFDDSTFLYGHSHGYGTVGDNRKEKSKNRRRNKSRREFVDQLLGHLRDLHRFGVLEEWGCQTRVDTISPSLCEQLAKAGCNYIYFGAESASDEQLLRMKKFQSHHDIERAVQHARDVGIRVGISTLFGVTDGADLTTQETTSTVDETMRFFSGEIRKGGIVTVSRNIMAYYPSSTQGHYGHRGQIDFWQGMPLAKEDMIPYPWNRFEDGAGHHADNFEADLAEHIAASGDQQLGPWSIKAYVHGASQKRRAAVTDLVHYTRARPAGSNFNDCFVEKLGELVSAKKDDVDVLAVGMHFLESIRQQAFLELPTSDYPVAVGCEPVWNSSSTDAICQAINAVSVEDLKHIDCACIPAVSPETGEVLDPVSIIETMIAKGFRGDLVLDTSDCETTYFQIPKFSVNESTRVMLINDLGRVYSKHIDDPPILTTALVESGSATVGPSSSFPETASATESIRRLRAKLDELVAEELPDAAVLSGDSPHICAIQIPDADHLAIVESLWLENGILTTYVGPMNCIRLQINETTTSGDLARCVSSIGLRLHDLS